MAADTAHLFAGATLAGGATGSPGCAGAATGAGGEQQYSLRWNDFHSAMVSSFRRLRDEEDFVDVTLACAGATFSAHKVVLSACSPYFRRLLKANPCQHPIVILRDVHDKDMESLLRFMYQGEVHIGQEQLKEFLKAAQLLQVRGLTDVPPPAPIANLDQKASPSGSSWTETGSAGSREGREPQSREGRRARRPEEGSSSTPPPKRARSSDLYQAQMKTRTEQLLAAQGTSPERLGTNGHELALFSHVLENAQNPQLSGQSNNLSGDGDDSSSDAGASDTESDVRAKQEPLDYDDASMATTNGALPHNFPGLLNLPGFPGLPGPSGIPDNFGTRRTQDLLRVRATDPRPCPKCGKIYRSAHTLRTHLEDKHTVCPGYRCVLCGTVAKSRNSLHSHMSRQHRGISTKDLPVLQMPTRFDPELASQLLAKAGVKVSAEQLRARASPTGPRRSDVRLDAKSAASETSSLAGDADHDDLSQPRYPDHHPVSPPNINNLTNTTITKVPAVRAVTAKTVENIPLGLSTGMKHDEYPPGFGENSALWDTYLQYFGENMFGMNAAKLAQFSAMHMDRTTYDEPNMGSLPPPTTLAHQRFFKQMQRQYPNNFGRADITRDSDEPLDLGKEKQRDSISENDGDKQEARDKEKDYYKEYNDDRNRSTNRETDQEQSGQEEEYSDDEQNKTS